MAQEVVIAGEVFKRRNPIAVWIGLPLITLGIYYFVWYYKINNEARRYLRDPSIRPGISLLAITLGWIIVVPPFVSIFRTGQRIRRMEENAGVADRCEPWIGLILAFFVSLDRLYLQIHLNNVWDAYLRQGTTTTALPAPLPPPPPPPLAPPASLPPAQPPPGA